MQRRKGHLFHQLRVSRCAVRSSRYHGVVTAVLCGATAILGIGCIHAQPTVHAAAVQAPTVPVRTSTSRTVKRGDTFCGALQALGIEKTTAHEFYSRLKPLGLTVVYPGDSICVVSSAAATVDTFSLLNKLEAWYRIVCRGATVTASRIPVSVSTHRCIVRGSLLTSLSVDMNQQGVGDALVGKFTDIFAWDINFFTEPRIGDRFEAVFEKRYAEGRFIGYGKILAAHYQSTAGRHWWAVGLSEPSAGDGMVYYDPDGRALQKQFLKAPLRFSHISSRFSFKRLHPVLGIVRPHLGIDYAASPGTPVYASADGTVSQAGWDNGYGNFVKISHGAAFQTLYGHLRSIRSGVRKGSVLQQGTLIGWVGATGIATGPHLDYRMMAGGRYVNPLAVSLPSKSCVAPSDRPAFEAAARMYETILDTRFRAESGCWVLDIHNSPVPAAPTHAVAAVLPHERKPGT